LYAIQPPLTLITCLNLITQPLLSVLSERFRGFTITILYAFFVSGNKATWHPRHSLLQFSIPTCMTCEVGKESLNKSANKTRSTVRANYGTVTGCPAIRWGVCPQTNVLHSPVTLPELCNYNWELMSRFATGNSVRLPPPPPPAPTIFLRFLPVHVSYTITFYAFSFSIC
jgi:hypothetical protein